MTTAATSLLGLALPVTGELSGVWGQTVNDSITTLLDSAVAGTTTLSTDADVTLTTTTLAANQARQAILLCSGARTGIKTITAPAQSKIYTIINATTGGYAVKLVGVGPTTGLTIPNGASAVVAWNGSDFIEVGSATVGNLTVNGNLSVTGTTTLTGAATLTANPTLSAGTANGVAYLNGSKVVTTGSALTFDGTSLFVGATSAAAGKMVVKDTSSSNTLWLIGRTSDGASSVSFRNAADSAYNARLEAVSGQLAFEVNGSEQMRLTSTGLGIGTSSPSFRLDVQAPTGVIKLTATTGTNACYYRADNSGGTLYFGLDNSTATTFGTAGAYGTVIQRPASTAFNINRAGTVDMYIDSSGNLGLGVTPSAWSVPAGKTMEIGTVGNSIWGVGASNMVVGANIYYASSSYKYANTGSAASAYQQAGGVHYWYYAASGTAGNSITFTQAMTLDASGNLGVGQTSLTNTRLWVESTYTRMMLGYNNTSTNYYDVDTHIFRNRAGSEAARIDSSGNLLIGTTSAGAGAGFATRVAADAGGNDCSLFKTSGGSSSASIRAWNSATTTDNTFVNFATETSYTSRGSITYNRGAGLVAYNTSSDYRAKDIIGPVENPGDVIDSVPVYIGKMKGATQERPMFIAHETPVYAHTGEKDAVDEDGKPVFQQMDVSALVPVMWAELQSLRARVAQLEAK